ncbi:MAG TPA: hypothetical protein VK465_16765, partial [Fibrobacteria bacterium]|nr:hypothetical protein [Fibrobacteria bacterium]
YYFEANKARYAKSGGADSAVAFESVARQVHADWAREKQAAQYQAYVERLLQTAKVRFHSPGTAAEPVPSGPGAEVTRP